MTAPPPDLTLVLACYNEERIIARGADDIFKILDALRLSCEVIFIDDASSDGTGGIIDRILREHPDRDLRKIAHDRNSGRGGAVSDGIRAARGRFVGFIDIDLEIQPAAILPCLLALERGFDVATAFRVYRFQPGALHRHLISRCYGVLVRWLTGTPLRDTETGFKFFRRDSILPVLDTVTEQGWFWDTEVMIKADVAGLRIVEIPALFERRTDKVSAVRICRDSLRQFRKLRQLSRALAAKKG